MKKYAFLFSILFCGCLNNSGNLTIEKYSNGKIHIITYTYKDSSIIENFDSSGILISRKKHLLEPLMNNADSIKAEKEFYEYKLEVEGLLDTIQIGQEYSLKVTLLECPKFDSAVLHYSFAPSVGNYKIEGMTLPFKNPLLFNFKADKKGAFAFGAFISEKNVIAYPSFSKRVFVK